MIHSPPDFAPVLAAAIARHGEAAMRFRLQAPKTAAELRAVQDDRYLSRMSLRIFRAGLKHELVDRKWPAFEEVFEGFAPATCAALYDEDIEAMLEDRRLIRHLGKLRAVRTNAGAMLAVAAEHGSFAAWIAAWPGSNIVGLWDQLARRFSQLGGNSAPVFLRMVGKDTFILTESVIKALGAWRALDRPPTSKRDRAGAQGGLRPLGCTGGPAALPSQPDCGVERRLIASSEGGYDEPPSAGAPKL